MYLIGSALCHSYIYNSFEGKTLREFLIDEIIYLDNQEQTNVYDTVDPEVVVDISIFILCLVLWPVFLIHLLDKK
jgi:hypothetical protein